MLRMAEGKRKYEFKRKKYVWMQVTKDRLSLPLIVRDTSAELAAACGISRTAVSSYISHFESGRDKGYPRYIRVIVEDEDDE